ncbi:ammonium transporter [Sphingomonas sp. ABOLG]|nr:ammonium transporter [Sphingomonas sp. ABOLG]
MAAGGRQLSVQAIAVAIVVIYAVIITTIILFLLDKLSKLRVPVEMQREGLDEPFYGESAFALWGMKSGKPE